MDNAFRQEGVVIRYLAIGLIILIALGIVTGAIFFATRNNTLGSDFFIYYVAGRQITTGAGSPYDETVGEQSQMAILKHPAQEGEDQLRYVYPPYGLIPILPLAGLPFPLAQAVWMAASIIGIPFSVLYGFRKVSLWFLISLFFLYPLTFGLLLGNMNMPVMCILILLAGRIPELTKEKRLESIILGLLMSWATIKPQFSAFFILFFLLVSLKNRNVTFIISFISGILGLIVFSFLLIHDWVTRWTGLLQRYPGYIGGQIPLTPLIERLPASWQLYAYVLLAVSCFAISAWLLVKWWNKKLSMWNMLAFGGFVTYLFHPTGLSYDQMIFLLPFIFWILKEWTSRPFFALITWFSMVVFSWVLLYLSLEHIWVGATYYGMFILYIFWMTACLWFKPARKNQIREQK
ncbi:MAG: DUF2029 domain-containing protein [Leptolinea sp.]|nr:DUF2029 domain-containing protein [Leptolinea sp.]